MTGALHQECRRPKKWVVQFTYRPCFRKGRLQSGGLVWGHKKFLGRGTEKTVRTAKSVRSSAVLPKIAF